MFCFKTSDDSLIHRLGNRRCIRRKKDQFHPIKRWHIWLGRAIICNQGNLALLGTKISINFFNPFFKQFKWYPTFWLYSIATWNIFHSFKTSQSLLLCQSQTLVVFIHLHYPRPSQLSEPCDACLLCAFSSYSDMSC